MLENLASDAEVLEKYGAPRREITLGHWITIRCRIETPVWDSRFCTGSRSDGRPGPDVGYAAAWERIAAGDHASAQDHALAGVTPWYGIALQHRIVLGG